MGKLVAPHLMDAENRRHGWVLEDFPQTLSQTSFLQEAAIVPTHVLVFEGDREAIFERNRQRAEDELEGNAMDSEVMERIFGSHACDVVSALAPYQSVTHRVDAFADPDVVWAEINRVMQVLPRSRGPRQPPRVILLGPRGVNLREHGGRLALQIGAVFVDAAQLQGCAPSEAATEVSFQTSLNLERLEKLIAADPLGVVGVRLRLPDCKQMGWVVCCFPSSESEAKILCDDPLLAPLRCAVIYGSAGLCTERLKDLAADEVTMAIHVTKPECKQLQKRLVQKPEDGPEAILAQHEGYMKGLPRILECFKPLGMCAEFHDVGDSDAIFAELVEFVERPLPLVCST